MRTVLALAIALAFGQAAQAADCSQLRIVNSVKMQVLPKYDFRTVPIKLNGVEKQFLVDSGAGLNLITEPAAKDLKLPRWPSNYRSTDLYRDASNEFVQVPDVEFGATRQSNIQFQVIGQPAEAKDPATAYDGILSTGLFLHDDVELDFGANRLNFFSTDHCDGRVVYWPHQVLSVVPVRLEGGHIVVPVTLDGHALTAMLDTGASSTVMRLDRAQNKLGFKPDAASAPADAPDDPKGPRYVRVFSTLSLEGVTIQNARVTILPLQFGGRSDATPIEKNIDMRANLASQDMVVGIDVLKHLHLYLAVKEKKLYVTEAGSSGDGAGEKPGPAP